MNQNQHDKSPARKRGRPPKSGRSSSETKQALIQSGLAHFTEFGFSSSGIDQVLKEVGVPKGSFYHYFSSKEDFGLAVIDSYNQYFKKKLDIHFLNEAEAPLQRLLNFVEDAKIGMARFDFRRGCLIGNLEREVTLLSAPLNQALSHVYEQWQSKLEQCLYTAIKAGDINKNVDSQQMAAFFWIGWEGAVSRCKLTQNTQPINTFMQQFLQLLR